MSIRGNHSLLATLALLAACGSDTHVMDSGAHVMDDAGSEEPPDYALPRDGANVVVTPVYRECTNNAGCVLVGVTCNGCCERDAIAASLTDEYQSAHEAACEGYSGAVCDCAPQPLQAVCVDGRCATAPEDGLDAGPSDDDDPCVALEGTFKSLEELECGQAPEGMEALCKWSLTFNQGEFNWLKSDFGVSGSYTCLDGSITAQALNESYTGTIAADGALSFDGVSYAR